jgi:hypothetical protein
MNDVNTRRNTLTRLSVFENLSPFPATRTSSARRLWTNVRSSRDGLRRGMGEITHAQVRAYLDARVATRRISNSRDPRAFRAASSPPRKPSKQNMRFCGGCVRDKTTSSRFFRVRRPSPLPMITSISTGHKKAWSGMCSVRRTSGLVHSAGKTCYASSRSISFFM